MTLVTHDTHDHIFSSGSCLFCLTVAVVAVLQFQNRFYQSQKLCLYLYIYYIYNIYINIEVFVGYGGNTSRELQQLQHCNNEPPFGCLIRICLLFICFCCTLLQKSRKTKKFSKKFVNRNPPFVPLHCQKKKGEQMTPARTSPALMINAPGVSVIHAASSG